MQTISRSFSAYRPTLWWWWTTREAFPPFSRSTRGELCTHPRESQPNSPTSHVFISVRCLGESEGRELRREGRGAVRAWFAHIRLGWWETNVASSSSSSSSHNLSTLLLGKRKEREEERKRGREGEEKETTGEKKGKLGSTGGFITCYNLTFNMFFFFSFSNCSWIFVGSRWWILY